MNAPWIAMVLAPSRRLGAAVVAAIVAALVIVLYSTAPLLTASQIETQPAPGPVASDRLASRKKVFDESLAKATETIASRAPFGQIKKPTRPTVVERRDPVPSSYGGPALVGIAENAAWFADGKRIKIGEENSGRKVVALDPPWYAKVQWSGGEYTVKLFDRHSAILSQPMSVWLGATPPTPEPPKPTPPPAAPPAAAPGALPIVVPGATAPGAPAAPVPGRPAVPGQAPPTSAPNSPPNSPPNTLSPGQQTGTPSTPAPAGVAPAGAPPTLPPVPVPVPTQPEPAPEPVPEEPDGK